MKHWGSAKQSGRMQSTAPLDKVAEPSHSNGDKTLGAGDDAERHAASDRNGRPTPATSNRFVDRSRRQIVAASDRFLPDPNRLKKRFLIEITRRCGCRAAFISACYRFLLLVTQQRPRIGRRVWRNHGNEVETCKDLACHRRPLATRPLVEARKAAPNDGLDGAADSSKQIISRPSS